HQKAMGLLPPAKALLARIPSAIIVDLDAGCCGMAGSFGYAREHYDVSRAIGERKLLPAARAMTEDTILVAAGTSCREQVKHFTGVGAWHSAELLAPFIENTMQNWLKAGTVPEQPHRVLARKALVTAHGSAPGGAAPFAATRERANFATSKN